MRWFSFALCLLVSSSSLFAEDWIESKKEFLLARSSHTQINSDGDMAIDPAAGAGPGAVRLGIMTSAVRDTQCASGIAMIGWISQEPPKTSISIEFRAGHDSFLPDDIQPAWQTVQNGQVDQLPAGRFCQYRVHFQADPSAQSPTLREMFLSTQNLVQRYGNKARPALTNLTMTMMYQATLYKLHNLYSTLSYDASERGMYILRQNPQTAITADSYQYQPMPAEMMLPARFGTWIVMRIHPTASFSDRTLRPSPTILRSKSGLEKNGPLAPHRAVNFFDEQFMQEYLAGISSAVRYYREHNPFVIGYTIMPPEFFYDTEPWPDMTYMGGFGDLAFRDYQAFMARLGIEVSAWPTFPENAISIDRDYYLWAYWRNWSAARYIARIAHVIRQADPHASVGTLCYTGDQALRGVEPAFIENNPDIDYYYSSTVFPRVPGPDGLTGGNILSLTRQITPGHSRKINLLEYDLWSPYVDEKRALTYARSAQIDHILPVSIVFGEFPVAGAPSDHLTKYHGMRGSPLSPELLQQLAVDIRETRHFQKENKQSQLAVILPSFSLYSSLQAGNWKIDRNAQLQMHIFRPLLEAGVTFDILTEGDVTTDKLDQYKLVITQSSTFYPWMKEALNSTKAHILALGFAGLVAAPGPRSVSVEPVKNADLSLQTMLPLDQTSGTQSSPLPLSGKLLSGPISIRINKNKHPFAAGMKTDDINYESAPINGVRSPFIGELSGESIWTDDQDRVLCAIKRSARHSVIQVGVPLHYVTASGKDASLLSQSDETRFISNVLDWAGIEYYAPLGSLRITRTDRHILIENTSAQQYSGPLPRPMRAPAVSETTITIPPHSSIVIPMPVTTTP